MPHPAIYVAVQHGLNYREELAVRKIYVALQQSLGVLV
jgi:hypothetical protein